MPNNKRNVAVIAIIIVVVAIIASTITWLVATKAQAPKQTTLSQSTEQSPSQTIETQKVPATTAPQKSLVEYYKTRFQFENNDDPLIYPEKYKKLIEVAKITTVCHPNPDGPCGGDILILSKEPLRTGDQEFYLAEPGGAGLGYFGPFTDNLTRLVEESKLIGSLNEYFPNR